MADFLNNLLVSQGCEISDGTMGHNPVTSLVDNFLDGLNSIGGAQAISHLNQQSGDSMFYGGSGNLENGYMPSFHPHASSQPIDMAVYMNGGGELLHNPNATGLSHGMGSQLLMPGPVGMRMGMGMPMMMPMSHHLQPMNFWQQPQHQQNRDIEYNEFDSSDQYDQEFDEDMIAVSDEGPSLDQIAREFREHLQGMPFEQGADYGYGDAYTTAAPKDSLHAAWNNILGNLQSGKIAPRDERVKEYEFKTAEENPYLREDTLRAEDASSLFDTGMEHFNAGRIPEAIMSFEAEIQRGADDASHSESESWHMLGMCHAENDEDKRAILCYARALECDPFNLDALLAAGISYVNELDSVRALESLRCWVTHNPKFQDLQVAVDEYSDGTLMDEVMQLMLAVAQQAPAAADPDVQIVLGVLYNVSLDYDTAATCLRQALSARPHDYSLLNKLGATLANSNRSAEAIPIYDEALAQRPRYARGWLNRGIACANLNAYEDAAQAYLRALRLNGSARHIWNYLRVVLTCMDRFDLVEAAGREDLAALSDALSVDVETPVIAVAAGVSGSGRLA